MTMLLTRPDVVVGHDVDAAAPHGHSADPTSGSAEALLLDVETLAPRHAERDRTDNAQPYAGPLQTIGLLGLAEKSDSGAMLASDLHDNLKCEATEQILRLMDRCQSLLMSADRLPAIRALLDGWTSIETDLVGCHGRAGSDAFWTAMRTATGRRIERNPGAAGLPIVVDSGMVVEGVAALLLASTPDFPALLRLNTSITSLSNRNAVVVWAERQISSGCRAATLKRDDLHALLGDAR